MRYYKIYGLKKIGDNEPIRYVGQTIKTLNQRLTSHKNDFRIKNKRTNWIKKHRDEIEIILIEEGIEDSEICNIRETFWILYYKEKYDLINANDGGMVSTGHKHSDEEKLKASNRMKINNPSFDDNIKKKISDRMKINNPSFNKETREKINKSLKGKGVKPIVQYDLNNNFIKEWDSATKIQEETGFNNSSILKCCNGAYKTSYSFIWKFKNK